MVSSSERKKAPYVTTGNGCHKHRIVYTGPFGSILMTTPRECPTDRERERGREGEIERERGGERESRIECWEER